MIDSDDVTLLLHHAASHRIASRHGTTRDAVQVRFLKSADSVVVDAASEVIGYLSGQGKHIKRLSFLVDGSVIKPNCNAATPTPTPTIPVANGGVKCREVDGGGTDAEECAEVLLPQRVAPPSKSRSDTSRLEDSTTAAEGGAAAEGTVTTPPQLTVDTVELPFAGAGETLGNKIWPVTSMTHHFVFVTSRT